MEKDISEREASGADAGAVKGTVTMIPNDEIGVHISMRVSSFIRQGENTVMARTLQPP